jgi:hypothetical protein
MGIDETNFRMPEIRERDGKISGIPDQVLSASRPCKPMGCCPANGSRSRQGANPANRPPWGQFRLCCENK